MFTGVILLITGLPDTDLAVIIGCILLLFMLGMRWAFQESFLGNGDTLNISAIFLRSLILLSAKAICCSVNFVFFMTTFLFLKVKIIARIFLVYLCPILWGRSVHSFKAGDCIFLG